MLLKGEAEITISATNIRVIGNARKNTDNIQNSWREATPKADGKGLY